MRFIKLLFFVLFGLLSACTSPSIVVDENLGLESAAEDDAPLDESRSDGAETSQLTEIKETEADFEAVPIIDQLASVFPGVEFAVANSGNGLTESEWKMADPEAQGLDSAQLGKLAPFLEEQMTHIHSVLVVRDGVLVYEFYKDGRTPYSADIVWSVTKSVTSLLIGIAADDGLLRLDQTLQELLPADQLEGSDPNLVTITVEELLTMTSGIGCPGDRCHDASVPTMLNKELNYATGEDFLYDTGATHLLSAVIGEVTGMPIHEYGAEKLFVPLGIEPPPWQVDKDGIPFGGKGLAMRPRDMAKIGQLILDDGVWDAQQIVSADYIAAASQNKVGDIHDEAYGYLFWIGAERGLGTISAVGYGGQFITVIPDSDMVVVITADFNPPRSGNAAIIDSFILQAIIN